MEVLWDVYPGVQVGGVGIRWYSVIYSLTLVAGWLMLIWQVKRGGGEERDANWLTAVCILGVFVGGRFGHLFFYEFERLSADWSMLWRFREGGISSHGGTFGLMLVIALFARVKRLPYLEVLDRASISFALAAGTIRLGNLFNSEVVGRLTGQSWGFRFPYFDRTADVPPLRHPSQIYEFVLGIGVMVVLLAVDRRYKEDRPLGLMIALFAALYFTGRFLIEFFKEYQTLPTDAPLTMGQLLSIPLALAGWVVVVWSLRTQRSAGWRNGPQNSG